MNLFIASPSVHFGSSDGARRLAAGCADPSLRRRARELRAGVADALEISLEEVAPSDADMEFSPSAMSSLARRCVARAEAATARDDDDAGPLYRLALNLQHLALELQREDLGARTMRFNDVADGLSRLRAVSGGRDLVDAACQEVAGRCGFARAVVSRIDADTWAPSAAHFAAADRSWFADWVDARIPLAPGSPERLTMSHRKTALVLDTDATEVHRPIIVESGNSTSYVVAPIVSQGEVVGLIHADHYPTDRRVDDLDRDVLRAFADGFSRLYERVDLLSRLESQRHQVRTITDTALRASDEHERVAGASFGVAVPVQVEAFDDLTPREAEVLRLMVAGHSNPAVASMLGISVDTVKSHVKQVLRKLGVSNRAQAIARAASTAPA
jgi:DNA-binding CsgD family transcriptional regulator